MPAGSLPELAPVAGIGLRDTHVRAIEERHPDVGWLEAHTENLFGDDPRRHRPMERLRAHYPLSLHGVGLSLGSAQPLDTGHLRQVAEVVRHYEPVLVSEHACWGAYGDRQSNQLLPLPLTMESACVLSERISQVQDELRRTLAIEPVAHYLEFGPAQMSEPAFLSEVVRRSGCTLLLDVSNLYINAHNFGFDPHDWLAAIPAQAVVEYHLAGFSDSNGILIDSHDRAIDAEVWRLYETVVRTLGPRPTLIEWDADLPPLETLVAERSKAESLLRNPEAAP